MDMYRENILDHAQNPRFPGVLDPADIDHEENNPLCGDRLRLTLRLDENNRITALAWDGQGCAISQASASMLGEHILGKTLEEVRAISKENIFELLGISLSPNRMKCALLSLQVLKVGTYGQGEWQKMQDEDED